MRRSLRTFAIAALLAIAAIWVAPSLLLPRLAARLASEAGVALELEGARPTLPFGVTVSKAVVVRGAGRVELTGVTARISPSGLRVEASVGGGTVLLRTDGLTLRAGILRAQSVALEALAGLVPVDVGLRGTADGVYRFGPSETFEGTVNRGGVALRAPVAVEIPFALLVIAAERDGDGGWQVGTADLRGPPLSGSAQGRLGADGQLALRIEISELEEPVRTVFRMAELPTEPLPFRADLTGTIEAPRFTPLAPEGE